MSGYRYPFTGILLAILLIDSVTKTWFWQLLPDLVAGQWFNLTERINSGSVSDFIFIEQDGLQSGIFNLADLANLTGLVILIGYILFQSKLR